MDLMLAITLPLAAVIRMWIAYRREVAITRWRTMQIAVALRGVPAKYRPRVINACTHLTQAGTPKTQVGQNR
ncbi:hypothetical protein SAMN05661093_06632 [Kibdelosporangium aridum]|uniref:Uncharacterized protein n=1 Tax=Kibdelosporangium aridum TaxID=2030 RepID=A0A1Y5XYA8_KIBAR|nr:hypothetical protein SAMN05661093_06632 [Kibdelosporangium aridum]